MFAEQNAMAFTPLSGFCLQLKHHFPFCGRGLVFGSILKGTQLPIATAQQAQRTGQLYLEIVQLETTINNSNKQAALFFFSLYSHAFGLD